MSFAQTIYSKLPVPLRNAAVQFVAKRNKRVRYSGVYSSYLQLLRDAEHWTLEQVRAYRTEELEKLLLECRHHVPHYKDSLAEFSDDDLREIAQTQDLSRLPLLEKSVRRNNSERFLNEGRKTALVGYTSGSTGSPMVTHSDAETIQRGFAFMAKHKEWAGVSQEMPSVRLSGNLVIPAERTSPPFWVANHAEKQLVVSTYHLNSSNMDAIWSAIEEWKPAFFDGYPTAVNLLATHAAKTGRALPSLKAVISTAELLTTELRESIERGLGVRVFDYYSASEGVPIVHQDQDGCYYLRPESGYIEILNSDGQPAAPGETGEIVATSFRQWKTPLIRYRCGDMATVATPEQERASLHPNFPMLGGIAGRVDDLIATPDGRLLGMFSYRLFKQVNGGVTEAQIIQKEPTVFEMLIVLDGSRPADAVKDEISRITANLLGYEPKITYRELDAIPRGPSGKFRTTIREFSLD